MKTVKTKNIRLCLLGWTGLALALITALPVGAQSTWTVRKPPAARGTPDTTLYSLAWTGSKFVAVGSYGTIKTSPDGIVWTSQISGVSSHLTSVIWTGIQLVAVGEYTTLRSFDGVSWLKSADSASTLEQLIWTGDRLITTGFDWKASPPNKVANSPDGAVWQINPGPIATLTASPSLTWTGNKLVAALGKVYTSTDYGVSWTTASTAFIAFSIVWTGNQLVGGGDKKILTSPDGISWTLRHTVPTSVGHVTKVGSLTLAWQGGSEDSVVYTSVDGIIWTQRKMAIPGLIAAATDGTQIVALLTRGAILTASLDPETPAVPEPAGPPNGAANQNRPVVLSWGQTPYTVDYRLQVSTDSLFSSLIADDSLLVSGSKTIVGLAGSTNYFWRVRSKNVAPSAWSNVRKFTTSGIPEAVLIGTKAFSRLSLEKGILRFTLSDREHVTILAMDLSGKRRVLLDETLNAGAYDLSVPKLGGKSQLIDFRAGRSHRLLSP